MLCPKCCFGIWTDKKIEVLFYKENYFVSYHDCHMYDTCGSRYSSFYSKHINWGVWIVGPIIKCSHPILLRSVSLLRIYLQYLLLPLSSGNIEYQLPVLFAVHVTLYQGRNWSDISTLVTFEIFDLRCLLTLETVCLWCLSFMWLSTEVDSLVTFEIVDFQCLFFIWLFS